MRRFNMGISICIVIYFLHVVKAEKGRQVGGYYYICLFQILQFYYLLLNSHNGMSNSKEAHSCS